MSPCRVALVLCFPRQALSPSQPALEPSSRRKWFQIHQTAWSWVSAFASLLSAQLSVLVPAVLASAAALPLTFLFNCSWPSPGLAVFFPAGVPHADMFLIICPSILPATSSLLC